MTRTHITMAVGLLLVLVRPAPAYAQRAAFLDAVGGLVTASSPSAVHASAARMRAALAEWDRSIATLELEIRGVRAGDPRATTSHVRLALAYGERGRLDDALRELDRAAAQGPALSDVELLRALTLTAGGRPGDASRAFAHAWTLAPDDPVKAYYAAIHAEPPERVQAQTALIDAYERISRRNPGSAPFPVLDPIPDALSAAPLVAGGATAEAFALLRAGRFAEAVAALGRPGEASRHADQHLARGRAAEAGGRVPDARREYEAALPETLAGRGTLLVGIARLAQVEGDAAAAIDAFTTAAALDPNDANIHKELALALEPQGRVDEALRETIAALLIDPRDAQAHAMIGQFRLDAGRPEDAVAPLTRALTLDPSRYETHYALATAFARLGRSDDAARERELFERGRLDAVRKRREQIAHDVDHEETVRRGRAAEGK